MLEEGQRYGYRQGAKGDFEQVEFVRQGRGRQAKRVLVRFLAEGQDQAEEWVPPQRLQVLWADVDQRRQDEANWAQLTAASPTASEGLVEAFGWAVDELLEPGVMEYAMDRNGVSLIYDVGALEQAIGCSVPHSEHSYRSARGYFVPTDVTLSIVKALVAGSSDKILRLVEQQEAQWREEEVRNHLLRNGRPKHPSEFEREEVKLTSWRYLRQWAGGDKPEQWQVLADTRAEAAKLRQLLTLAIEKLEKYGHEASARTMRGYMDGAPLPSNLKKDWGR
ncbi:hypothetical protein D6T63_04195 [Arthrobacter cheniae]|uniref:Uncharacterized protein n=1 Tax=Arthrobacter cheniae TaxID=1258888 RepID=A0A3A5ME11_9MICC|nr:hypothetical protein [Arthrobacter cheniae]RJT81955.1 hypothetical protein D6T63_04195 [Arthrobacter cheniae]